MLPTQHAAQSTLRSTLSRGGSLLGLSREQSIDERASSSSGPSAHPHAHWCIVCENPQPIYTCDGWKRHMKEHETFYPCILCGPASTLGSARTFTRKVNLVKHLQESHSIPNGLSLANQWKSTQSKKAYACGFCITSFNTLADQMNHIDTQHYRQSHDISQYDHNNVIKGLLLQSGVTNAWQHILTSNSLSHSDCSWHTSIVADLQVRLEMREDSPEALAEEALVSTEYYYNRHAEDQSMTALDPMDQDMDAGQAWPAARPEPNISHGPLSSALNYTGNTAGPLEEAYPHELPRSAFENGIDDSSLDPSPAQHDASSVTTPFAGNGNNAPYCQDMTQFGQAIPTSQLDPAYPPNAGAQDTHVPPPNYFRGIGGWQEYDFRNGPPTASASEPSEYQDDQPHHPEVPNTDTTNHFLTTHDRLNPNNNTDAQRRQHSLFSQFQRKMSLSASQDDNEPQSQSRDSHNSRQCRRRGDNDPRNTCHD
ncbi:hypothetical protein OEA41_010792 [Lepraria neglecta]|uniref:C2H2-type domain-containing protein n=1 Tax=Lepraria neglecta TaxID=209136 RepID=A0AAE0DFV8_9LECA|nr:hypothetical protein OEA41_010792 [Lepraria neglecta]